MSKHMRNGHTTKIKNPKGTLDITANGVTIAFFSLETGTLELMPLHPEEIAKLPGLEFNGRYVKVVA